MYSKQIEGLINEAPEGTIFVISDFSSISVCETARKKLSRLESDGVLKKVMRGVYYKPKYSFLLNEYVEPDIIFVAEAIARNFSWTIVPSGDTALNLLGLSTQVPGCYSFISSGPYREYTINNTKIEFLHRSDKDMTGMSFKTRLIIQAIKSIGKERMDEYIPKFKNLLQKEEKESLLNESTRTTAWVHETIKLITKDN